MGGPRIDLKSETGLSGFVRIGQLSERKDGGFCLLYPTHYPVVTGFITPWGVYHAFIAFDAKKIFGTASSYVSQEPSGTHFE